MLPLDEIDTRMQPIIKALNNAKLTTQFCCQGNHDEQSTPQIAYLSFAPKTNIPRKIVAYAEKHGWHVSLENLKAGDTFTFYAVKNSFIYQKQELIDKNEAFIAGWRNITKGLIK
tara:strand:+ start:281 stop:625 length:345 start_codon:yes stop_codon:yes gene_type:complete